MPIHSKTLPALLLFLSLAPGPLGATPVVDKDSTTTPSRYTQTLRALQTADQGQQREFASSAIDALVEVYYAEADLALREASDNEEDGKDRRSWALSVESYTQLLLAARNSIAEGHDVRLFPGVGGEAGMIVAGDYRVMLSHPRGDQQAAYEQQVLNTFCRKTDCQALVPAPRVTAPLPPLPEPVAIQWSFSRDGMNCRYQGVNLLFSRQSDAQRARPLCEQIYSELAALEEELRWQLWRGVSIEWSQLEIQRRIGQTGHSVRLNAAGDVLLLRLPVLAANGQLFKALQTWLRDSVADTEEGFQLTLRAADYGLEVAQ